MAPFGSYLNEEQYTSIRSKTDLERAMESDAAVIHVVASWCGPCRMTEGFWNADDVAQVVEETGARLYVVDSDMEGVSSLPVVNCRSVPHIFYLRGGKVVHQDMGTRPRKHYISMLREHFS